MDTRNLKFLDRLLKQIVARVPQRALVDVGHQPRSILVIKLSAMGDALCLMPAVRMIALAFPFATVDWLTTARTNPQVLKNLKFLNSTILLPTINFSIFTTLIKKLWKFRGYDLIIDFDQYYQVSELLARCGKVSAGFDAPLKGGSFTMKLTYEPELNERYQFRNLARRVINHWVEDCPNYDPGLPEITLGYIPSNKFSEAVRTLKSAKRPILVIYPGSSRNATFRRWDWNNYEQIILRFQQYCEVVIAGGSDEDDISIALQKQKDIKAHNWIGRWSLLDWAWMFQKERPYFVGNDGGLLHMAEAVGLPVIGIFGPSHFTKWGSVNPDSIAFEAEVECRPCLRNYLGEVPQECWKGTSECLTRISLTDVIDVIEESISKSEKSSGRGGVS